MEALSDLQAKILMSLSNMDVSDMEQLLVKDGRVQEASADVWLQFDALKRRAFMNKYAIYVAPTTELLDFLDHRIGDTSVIEICAGMGYIGQALNIEHITDSYIQTGIMKDYIIARGGVPTNPPKFVERLEAIQAAKKYRPHTVLVCFGTHKSYYGSGNDFGVDYKELKKYCKRIIFVGNLRTHQHNPMVQCPCDIIPGIITTGEDTLNGIFTWEKRF